MTNTSGEDETLSSNKPTENLAAFDAYLQSRLFMRPDGNKKEDLDKAIAFADEAIIFTRYQVKLSSQGA